VDKKGSRLVNIEGMPPDLLTPPQSCQFAARCVYAYDRCRAEVPPLTLAAADHESACWWDMDRGKPRYDR
jgi:oligopeptide/dipeptide ABC transporter ATP-binding protein